MVHPPPGALVLAPTDAFGGGIRFRQWGNTHLLFECPPPRDVVEGGGGGTPLLPGSPYGPPPKAGEKV